MIVVGMNLLATIFAAVRLAAAKRANRFSLKIRGAFPVSKDIGSKGGMSLFYGPDSVKASPFRNCIELDIPEPRPEGRLGKFLL
jgi:hypothetical protein